MEYILFLDLLMSPRLDFSYSTTKRTEFQFHAWVLAKRMTPIFTRNIIESIRESQTQSKVDKKGMPRQRTTSRKWTARKWKRDLQEAWWRNRDGRARVRTPSIPRSGEVVPFHYQRGKIQRKGSSLCLSGIVRSTISKVTWNQSILYRRGVNQQEAITILCCLGKLE